MIAMLNRNGRTGWRAGAAFLLLAALTVGCGAKTEEAGSFGDAGPAATLAAAAGTPGVSAAAASTPGGLAPSAAATAPAASAAPSAAPAPAVSAAPADGQPASAASGFPAPATAAAVSAAAAQPSPPQEQAAAPQATAAPAGQPAAAPATQPAPSEKGADTAQKDDKTIQWSEFFDDEKQDTPSERFWDLNGKTVTIRGYMGEVLSFEKHWFLVIPAPGAECPFDNGDETYWNKIMIAFTDKGEKLRYTAGPMEITGRLDVGIKIDESGYKTMFRLYNASFTKLKE